MEWLPNVKRTKKTKKPSAKGADPIDRPSSSSPQSFFDGHNESTLSSTDREWLQSEFASVKKQNRLIEEQNRVLKERLDFLIKYTVRVDFSDDVHPGAKRPRPAARYPSDTIAPTPINDRAFHQDPDDSLNNYIDAMLGENLNEESKELIEDEYFEGGGSFARDHHRRDSHSFAASIINSLGSESGKLHSLASNSQDIAPTDQQDDLTPPNRNAMQPRTEWVPRANCLDEKATGPELVCSTQDAPPVTASSTIDADEDKVPEWVNLVPPDQPVADEYHRSSNRDEEQGVHFTDMTLVSAHLVESERGITLDNSAAQVIIASQQQHVRQLSKRVMWAVAILIIVAIVSLTSTIIITNHEAPEMSAGEDADDPTSSNDNHENEYSEETEGVSTSNLPFREDTDTDHSNAATAVSDQEDSTGTSDSLSSGAKTSTLSSSASNAALYVEDSSSDYSPSGSLRRWKDWNKTDEYSEDITEEMRDNIFDWHPPDTSKYNITDQVLSSDPTDPISLPSDKGELTFTELSLTINGGVETFRCYHQ